MPETLQGVAGFPRKARLSPRVHRILGMNPGLFTGPGTNTYLVGMDGESPLLIDTGSGVPKWMELLREHLEECGAPIPGRVLFTHGHPDHTGGVGQVREAFPDAVLFKLPWQGVDDPDVPWHILREGEAVVGPGYTLRPLHTPGHAPDHLCYYLEEEGALFSGDVVLGVGTTVIPREGGNLTEYMASLRRLKQLPLERIYPGHGPVIEDGRAKVEEYIAHRMERETQVLATMADGPLSVMEMVRVIYRDYPENLYPAAAQSVLAHLDKLEGEARVARAAGETAPAQESDQVYQLA